jgi:DNA invertase Pin-like site-specific DNA recombinase
VRFSSKKQELSDSKRRQIDMAHQYAVANGLTLDPSGFEDLGVSAFRGKNSTDGALGDFLRCVDEGWIPNDSWLLVESLDRVSRNQVNDALQLFLSIINKGITIVSLIDNQIYSRETTNKDRGIGLIISITQFIRSHEESLTKSTRIKAAWTNKRNNNQILTKVCPAWLYYSDITKQFDIHKDKADIVRLIFAECLKGKGTPTIAVLLNQLGHKPIGTAQQWSPALVSHVLKNKSTYGLYYPKKAIAESIEDYYPAIISKDIFDRANSIIDDRHHNKTGGNRNNVTNLFTGKLYCALCDSKYRYVSKKGKHKYIQCINAYNTGDCKAIKLNYDDLEQTILHSIGQVMGFPNYSPPDDGRAELKQKIAEKNIQIQNLIDVAMNMKNSGQVGDKITLLQDELKKLEHQLINKPRKTNIADVHLSALSLWSKGNKDKTNMDIRRELQSHINRLLDKVVIDGIDEIEEYSDLWVRRITITGEVFTLIRQYNENELTQARENWSKNVEPGTGLITSMEAYIYLGRYGFGNGIRNKRHPSQQD